MSKKFVDLFKKAIVGNVPALISCSVFVAAGIVVCLNRYWQYDVFYHDFGIFDTAIWRVSRFQPPIIDHLLLGGKWIFADHFNPSIFLLSPLYWLTDRSEVLLIAQVLAVGISGYILYVIGKAVLHNSFLSLAIMWCYYLFVGLQNALITDFHEVTVMSLPFMLVFWAFVKRKKFWYFFFLLLTLGFKESNFAVGIGIGFAIFFLEKSWRKVAFWTVLISIMWGFISIKIIIPYFSRGIYLYNLNPDSLGFHLFLGLFDNPVKIRTVFFSFLSFGLLPLFSPAFWILILQDFFIRFIPNIAARWDLGFHYSIELAVIFGVSSVYGLKNLFKVSFLFKNRKIIGLLLIVNAFFLFAHILHGPLALAYNPVFYQHTKDFLFLDNLVKKVPRNARIMAQNNLATRFTHGDAWVLVDNYEDRRPDYIVMDIRGGQNPNDYYGVADLPKFIENLKSDKNYKIIYAKNDQFIYKRVTKD